MCPSISIPKANLESAPPIPAGMYSVRLDGFKPSLSKAAPGKTQSVNLNPQMKIVNHADSKLVNRNIFDSLNIQAGWVHKDFSHAFGQPMVSDDGGATFHIPGGFEGPDNDPSKWQYRGPLTGQVGQLEVAQVSNNKGGFRSVIKRYMCKIPNCQESHTADLT